MWWLAVAAALDAAPPGNERDLTLQWEAPPHCPDAMDVEQRVHALLEASTVRSGAAEVRARGRVRAIATGYELDLLVEGETQVGDRHLESADCGELAQASALIIAIAIDPSSIWSPDVVDVPPPPPPESPEVHPPITEPEVMPPPAPPEASEAARWDARAGDAVSPGPRRPGFAIRGGAGIDALSWRPIGASLVLAGALVGRGYRVEVAARYAAPSTISAESSSALKTRAQQWSVGVAGCGVPAFGPDRRVELPLCAGIEAGAFHAQGVGDGLIGRRTHAPWVAASAGAGVIWVFAPRLALWLAADAFVLVGRPLFVTDQGTVVLHPRRAGLRTLVGVEVRFGAAAR